MTDAIHSYLHALYPAETAAQLYRELMARIGNKPAAARGELFTERDVTLITYGDSLQREGEPPLQTLYTFASEHLVAGMSHIHILPFYPYSSDDGFSVVDFYAVNPDLGDWDDVNRLGERFQLMFDAVFNHMSAKSDWFARFLADDAEFGDMFVSELRDTDLSAVTRPRTSPLLTAFTKANGEIVHVWTTFSADQVDINFADPQTLLRMIDVLLFYIQQGATVVRLDAIAYLWKRIGTTCIHLDETHIVIKLMRAVLDVVAPQTILITETNVPHTENISYFGNGTDEAQMVYNFTLPPLLFHTMHSGDSTRLREWINTLDTPSDQSTFFNFTASHDGIGVRPVEGILNHDELVALIAHVEQSGGQVSYKTNADGSQSPYELNVTYVDAIVDPCEPIPMQAKRFLVSQAIALSLAGMPAIYIHSLLGSRNNLGGVTETGMKRTINRAKLDADAIREELNDPNSFRALIFTPYLHLIQTRIKQPDFHPNAYQGALDVGNPAVVAIQRGERLLALHNITGAQQKIDLGARFGQTGTDCLTGQAFALSTITLDPYAIHWVLF